ncbi:hypothetical protein VZT92_007851 [Zoarces viviparus]|uniref:Uncharacterized protein n=1 Tax=Zoarces viviparus TaxID=48416 RepID=A0AAW1FKR8_ZOAVI
MMSCHVLGKGVLGKGWGRQPKRAIRIETCKEQDGIRRGTPSKCSTEKHWTSFDSRIGGLRLCSRKEDRSS